MSKIKLTVAIPTYNRSAMLMTVANALSRQSAGLDNFYFVVVDNASTDILFVISFGNTESL